MKHKKLIVLSIYLLSTYLLADDLIDDFDSSIQPYDNSVITPARLKQSMRDVPAGVTVITYSKIQELGISSIPEAMRLVPGMRITQASGWDYRINFHGTNALIPKRMLVLVNGIAIHRYGFAEIDWSLIPVDIEDIERIEVTRSPSSASYGSNAFQTVVSIITKHPDDVETVTLVGENGSNNAYKYYGRYSGTIDNTSFLLSLGKQGDDGFDYVEFDREKPPTPGAVDDHDVERVLFRSNSLISDASHLELNVGYIWARVEDEEVDSNQLAPPDRTERDWNLHVIYTHTIDDNHYLKIQASYRNDEFLETWDACNLTAAFVSELRDLSDVNSEAAWTLLRGEFPVGQTEEEQTLINIAALRFQELGAELTRPICGTGNQDHETQKRIIEIEDTIALGEIFRVNTGIGYQNNDITSETYVGGRVGSIHKYLFSNAEYKPSSKITINLGFMYEDIDTVDDAAFAPRVGLNYHITPNQTIRAVYSTGKRMPNILETDRYWTYLVRNWDHEFDGRTEGKFFLTTVSPEGLKPESIESFELGLHGYLVQSNFKYDIRIFYEEQTDLISEKGEFFSYSLTNENKSELTGFEAEASYRFTPTIELSAGYSYLDAKTSNVFEDTLHADHQGFASLVYRGDTLKTALTHYSNSAITQSSFDRTDLSISTDFPLYRDLILNARLVGSHNWHDDVSYQWRIENRAVHSYNQSEAIKLQLRISY